MYKTKTFSSKLSQFATWSHFLLWYFSATCWVSKTTWLKLIMRSFPASFSQITSKTNQQIFRTEKLKVVVFCTFTNLTISKAHLWIFCEEVLKYRINWNTLNDVFFWRLQLQKLGVNRRTGSLKPWKKKCVTRKIWFYQPNPRGTDAITHRWQHDWHFYS